jgi:hypothetical protein
VKELRRFLTERSVDSSSIVEKQELIEAVSAVAQLPTMTCAVRPAACLVYHQDILPLTATLHRTTIHCGSEPPAASTRSPAGNVMCLRSLPSLCR